MGDLISSQQSSSDPPIESKNDELNNINCIQKCKLKSKCPIIKNIKQKNYTGSFLNHLTEYTHPRKICMNGINCKHFNDLLNGSYNIDDICHYAIYLHPKSRFITSNIDDNNKTNTNNNKIKRKKRDNICGIMICNGNCGNIITKGLYKCFIYRELIWTYKYKKYDNSNTNNDIQKCLITMIESVVALAGEQFLNKIYDIISDINDNSNNSNNNSVNDNDIDNDINTDFKEDDIDTIDDDSNNVNKFGKLLLLFSNIVRKEFGYDDDYYPVIRKNKKWQIPIVYGIIIGFVNDKLNVKDINNPNKN